MVKTQIQLDEADLAILRRAAAERKVSVSELVRRAVRESLRAMTSPTTTDLWECAGRVVGRFNSGKTDVGRRHDDYLTEDFRG